MNNNSEFTKARYQKKHEDIKKEWKKLTSKKNDGVRIYTNAYIIAKLSKKYYLAEGTIENIIYSN